MVVDIISGIKPTPAGNTCMMVVSDESGDRGVKHRATTREKKGPGRPRKSGGGRPPLAEKSSNSNSPTQTKRKVGRPKKMVGKEKFRTSEKIVGKKVSTNEVLKGRGCCAAL